MASSVRACSRHLDGPCVASVNRNLGREVHDEANQLGPDELHSNSLRRRTVLRV